jgi:hypothetical protein
LTLVKAAVGKSWQKEGVFKPTPPPMSAPRPALYPWITLIAVAVAFPTSSAAQGVPDYEKPPVSYSATPPADAVAALQRRLDATLPKWKGDDRAVLAALLEELRVPVASQVVVFSKTSLQRGLIQPRHPRVIYFSDDAYVGWVPGGVMEVTAIDPVLGPVFYALDPRGFARGEPRFVRDGECLSCHGGSFVRDVPGVLVRTVFPSRNGEPLLRFGSAVVDDQTAFGDRWGGWYVTGYHGEVPHRGNAFAAEVGEHLDFTPAAARPDELSAFFDTSAYLATTSDVVALLLLEHQTSMHNTITRAAFATRRMIAYQRGLQRTFKEPETDEPAYDSVRSVFNGAAQDIVDRLLFRDAADLPSGVDGGKEFRAAYAAGARRTAAGLSLRDLDLKARLFARRCSPLIYSETFAALPAPLKNLVFARLRAVLESDDPTGRYAYLPAAERRQILEILRETQPEAAHRWSSGRPLPVSAKSDGE